MNTKIKKHLCAVSGILLATVLTGLTALTNGFAGADSLSGNEVPALTASSNIAADEETPMESGSIADENLPTQEEAGDEPATGAQSTASSDEDSPNATTDTDTRESSLESQPSKAESSASDSSDSTESSAAVQSSAPSGSPIPTESGSGSEADVTSVTAESESETGTSGNSMSRMSAYASSDPVPAPGDYVISGGTIQKLSADYINSLTEDQKQNIRLVIPEEINGQKVTSIAQYAFRPSNYSGCTFTGLDLSQAVHLTSIQNYAFYQCNGLTGPLTLPEGLISIGQQAFEGCSGLTGDLFLPDSLTSLGTHVFDGCSGLNGSLRLPDNAAFTKIPEYAFQKCMFTGTLTIPPSVTSIGASAFRLGSAAVSFTGELRIPDSVATIQTAAFLNQKGFSSLTLPAALSSIPESAFKYTGISGTLVLSESITSIGNGAFRGTGLKTVYLPSSVTLGGTGVFDECSLLTAIVCTSKEQYSTLYSSLSSSGKGKLSYPVMLHFQGDSGNSYPDRECLFNRPINYIKDADLSWSADSSYRLPTLPAGDGAYQYKWCSDQAGLKPVSETSLLSFDTVYAVKSLANPVITYGEGVSKTYDGQPFALTVNASHPKAVEIGQAKDGDVVFYYTWKWETISGDGSIQKGFDLTSLEVTDSCDRWCMVTVQACLVEGGKAKVFYTEHHEYPVSIRQAPSFVHPLISSDSVYIGDGLPAIKLSADDTKGTLLWDEGQTLTEGVNTCSWTFTPDSDNYTPLTGTALITARSYYLVTASVTGGGSSMPAGPLKAPKGGTLTVTFPADSGYKLESVFLDGTDITADLTDASYTLSDIQSDHTLTVCFIKMTAKDVEEVISKLPDPGTAPTPEQVQNILDTHIALDKLEKAEKDAVTDQALDSLYNALAALPQTDVRTSGGITAANPAALLQSMTAEDAEALKGSQDVSCLVRLQITDAIPDPDASELINSALNGYTAGTHYEISIVKELITIDSAQTTPVTALDHEIELSLDIPEILRSVPAGYTRSFSILRLHTGEDGTLQAQILPDLDSSPDTVTIKSDRFSVYSLIYRDQKQGGGSETEKATEGSTSVAAPSTSPAADTHAANTTGSAQTLDAQDNTPSSDSAGSKPSTGAAGFRGQSKPSSSDTSASSFDSSVRTSSASMTESVTADAESQAGETKADVSETDAQEHTSLPEEAPVTEQNFSWPLFAAIMTALILMILILLLLLRRKGKKGR